MLSKMVSIAVSHYIPVMYCDTLMGLNFNPNNEICKIIEIQYGEEVKESDIERLYYFDQKKK